MRCGKVFESVVILWAFLAALFGNAQAPEQYVTAQSLVLHQKGNGVDGTLQLMLDKRLTTSAQETLWGKGEWDFALSPESSLYKEFSNRPPVKSKLCIRNSMGKIVVERDLETPQAKLEAWKPSGQAEQLFLLTQDNSSGAGSYSGLGTTILTVSDATFHEVNALDARTHREEPIRLMKALKSDWRITQQGDKPEILSVSSHPKDADGNFVTVCIRYSLDQGRWIKYSQERDGIWESDEPFPEMSAFH
jgi:hypothetical protein